MSDPGQAETPNAPRGVPTVMGPDSSAANTAYATPSKVSGKINPANIGTKGFNSPQQFQDERALTMSSLPNELRFCGG